MSHASYCKWPIDEYFWNISLVYFILDEGKII